MDSSLTEKQLEKHFSKYGRVTRIGFDKYTGTAMIQYETLDEARDALGHLKGTTIGGSRKKIMVCDVWYYVYCMCNVVSFLLFV